jgi:hypothetical protein
MSTPAGQNPGPEERLMIVMVALRDSMRVRIEDEDRGLQFAIFYPLSSILKA